MNSIAVSSSKMDAQVLGNVCRFLTTHRDMLCSSLRLVSSTNPAQTALANDLEEVSLILSILFHSAGDAELLLRYLGHAVFSFDAAVYECARDICGLISSSSSESGARGDMVYWKLLRLAVGYCEKRTPRNEQAGFSPDLAKAMKSDVKLQEFEIEVIVSCIKTSAQKMLFYFPIVSAAAPARKEKGADAAQRTLIEFCLENSLAVLYWKVRSIKQLARSQSEGVRRVADVLCRPSLFGHYFGKSDKRSDLETFEQSIIDDPAFAFVLLLLRKTRDLHYSSTSQPAAGNLIGDRKSAGSNAAAAPAPPKFTFIR